MEVSSVIWKLTASDGRKSTLEVIPVPRGLGLLQPLGDHLNLPRFSAEEGSQDILRSGVAGQLENEGVCL